MIELEVITTIFHILNKIEESINILRRDTEDISKSQVSLLEIKITVSRIRNTVNGIDSRLGQAEQVREFKDIVIKLSKMKHTERKDGKKNKQSFSLLFKVA